MKTKIFFTESNFAKKSLVALTIFSGSILQGIELENNRPYDAQSKMGVSSAESLPSGAMATSLNVYQSLSLLPQKHIISQDTMENQDTSLLVRAARSSLLIGYGISDYLELNLGLSGTYEYMSESMKAEFYGSQDEFSTQHSYTPYAYAGSSLLLKMRLYKNEDLAVALAPYIAEGLGEKAGEALTRPKKPTGGWKGIFSYGSVHRFNLNLVAGYQYSAPEALGELTVRNRMIIDTTLVQPLTPAFSLFLVNKNQRLMVADSAKQEEGKKQKYEALWANAFGVGIEVKADQISYQLYGAMSPKENRGLGFGKSHVGMSLSMNLGGEASRTHDAQRKIVEKTPVRKSVIDELYDAKNDQNEYPEMNGQTTYNHNGLTHSTGNPGEEIDFAKLEQEASGMKNIKSDTDIRSLENELTQIKAAEANAQKKEASLRKNNDEKIRREQIKNLAQKKQQAKKYRKQVLEEQETKRLGVSDDDVNWRGLE